MLSATVRQFFGVVLCMVLTVLAVYQWSLAGTFTKNISEASNTRGMVALVAFDLLGIFSLPCVRSRSYNLFFATHVVGLTTVLFFVSVFSCMCHCCC